MNTTQEIDLLDTGVRLSSYPFTGNMFIMESSQVGDDNTDRTQLFRNDLERFLGLEYNQLNDIASGERTNVQHSHSHLSNKEFLDKNQIDICEEQHSPVRDVLVKNGIKASRWIEDYLLKSPRVVVSSKDYFLELIAKWKLDPCNEESSV